MTKRRTKPQGAYIGKEDDFQASAIRLVRSIVAPYGVDPKAVMHVPNGGKRNVVVASKLKRMGTVPGYPDIMVFEPSGGWCGLALELKVWPNKPTEDQLAVHELLANARWCVAVCYGLDEVERRTVAYMKAEN